MKDNKHPMEDLNKIHEGVVNAAYEIIEKKKATYYGIGMALNRLVKAIIDDENSILTVSTYLENQYGQTRLELAEVNAKIMKQITQSVMETGFKGIFVVASNPVDLMAYVVWKVSGLPKNRVIGSGTVLDTARLRYLMADYLKVSSKNVHAYIMGEHGDSSFVPWNHAYVG